MKLQRGERRIKSAMPALQLAWMVVYFPMLGSQLVSKHPVIFLSLLGVLLLLMACARRVSLTTERVAVDRPLLSWLSFLRFFDQADGEFTDEHRLRELTHAEVDGRTLVLVYRSGVRARIEPVLNHADAFAEAVNERIASLLSEQVKISERPATTLGLHASSTALLRCPYCHDDLVAFRATRCGGCNTPHHGECLTELGSCSVMGCAGRVKVAA